MQDMRGKVKRRLSLLRFAGSPSSRAGHPVHNEAGGEVGAITSMARAVAGEPGFAIARLQAPNFEPGTTLTVGAVRASVAPLWS
jgi:glycine cleavage system aminomethyltransferase T